MIHVFKSGGEWKTDCGINYTCKAIREEDKTSYLSNEWVLSLDEIKASTKTNKTKQVKAKNTKQTENK